MSGVGRSFSVREKLIALAVGTALFALLVACGSFVYYDRTSYALAKQRTSGVLVESVANSMFGPTAFQDEESAKTVLKVLEAEPAAQAAAVYTAEKQLLADWKRGKTPGLAKQLDQARRDGYAGAVLQLTRPIAQPPAAPVGYLRVAFSTDDIQARTERFLQIAGLVLFVVALMAGALSWFLSAKLTRPVELLHAAATAVQERQDFDVRAERVSNDELGQLTDAFNAMLAMIQVRDRELAGHRVHLEELVEARTRSLDERNQEMRLVFDNVEQGFLTLDREGQLGPERSAIGDLWFGKPGPEVSLADYLETAAPGFRDAFAMHWSQLIEGFLPIELNLAQLPAHMQTTLGRHYELAYRPIHVQGDQFEKLLVIITDISARLEQERSEAEQTQIMAMFENITSDRRGFTDFLEEADRLVAGLTEEQAREQALALRELHTLKGNFGLFALKPLAKLIHTIESDCIESGEGMSVAQKSELLAAWRRFRSKADSFLGHHPNTVSVEAGELEAIVRSARRGARSEELAQLVEKLAQEPVAPKLARMGQRAQTLAQRLGKGPIEVEVDADGVRTAPQLTWLWQVLPHAINNSVDHGLPRPEEVAQGQAKTGRLKLSARERSGELCVEIEDNGRGIDWDKVRVKAQRLGMRVSDHAALSEAIFAQGVSTRDAATEVSGRGVGLAALKAACQQHGARVLVRSQPGLGTTFQILLKAPVANIAESIRPSPRRSA